MNNDNGKSLSRRELLSLAVGAGLLGGLDATVGIAGSVEPAFGRALVCVYLFGGIGESKLASKSGDAALHPAALELHNLRQRGALRVLRDFNSPARPSESGLSPEDVMAERYAGLRFLPNGFATPEWAARLAGVQGCEGSGAYTFQNGMSLVVPGGATWQGAQFENPTLRQAMDQVQVRPSTFPDTAVGRQLVDITRLLLASAELGIRRPIFLCTADGFSQSAHKSGALAVRYEELSGAMKAFHEATLARGLDRFVTTYTDSESPAVAGRIRLVMGGAAAESAITLNVAPAGYPESLVRWHGSRSDSPFLRNA